MIDYYEKNYYYTIGFTVDEAQKVIIQVINNLGQVVYKEENNSYSGNFNKELNLSFLQNGIYELHIKIGEKEYTENVSVMK